MATHPKCGKSWTGYRPEHCPVCCETFTGTEAGDRHRVGDYNDGSRRCLTPDEMRAKSMGQDDRGMWQLLRNRPDAPQWGAREDSGSVQGEGVPQ